MIQYKCDYNMMNEVNLYEKNGKIIFSLHTVGAATIDKNYSKSSAAYYAKMWAKGYNTAGYYNQI